MYDRIHNPSRTHTMVATFRQPRPRYEDTHYAKPGGDIPTVGKVNWLLWSLSWVAPQGFDIPGWDLQ